MGQSHAGAVASSRRRTLFNPNTQVTALHAMWASDPLWTPPADGAAVSSWRNESGGGDPAQGSGTLQPLYRASSSGMGNRPAIEFDGTDDRLVFDIADTAQPFKAISVHRMTNTSNSTNPVGFGGNTSNGFTINGSNFYGVSGGTVVAGTVAKDQVAHIHRATMNGSSTSYWTDEVLQFSAGGAGTTGLTYLKVGCAGSGATHGRFAACQVSFVGFYSNATSDTDLAQLCADLKTYYGIA